MLKRFALISVFLLPAALLTAPLALAEMDHDTSSHAGHAASATASLSPTGMTADEELNYSLFMHRSSGVALLVVGALLLTDRLTRGRYMQIIFGIGLLWIVFGAHLFIRSDPEGWPIGPAGFLESFSMPTASEWIQHKVLSLIPLAIGVWTFATHHRAPDWRWSYVVGGLMAVGGASLLLHQHADHPGMDLVNLQHRFMALTALFIASSMVADVRESWTWKVKPLLLPCGLMVLGLQLAVYVE